MRRKHHNEHQNAEWPDSNGIDRNLTFSLTFRGRGLLDIGMQKGQEKVTDINRGMEENMYFERTRILPQSYDLQFHRAESMESLGQVIILLQGAEVFH